MRRDGYRKALATAARSVSFAEHRSCPFLPHYDLLRNDLPRTYNSASKQRLFASRPNLECRGYTPFNGITEVGARFLCNTGEWRARSTQKPTSWWLEKPRTLPFVQMLSGGWNWAVCSLAPLGGCGAKADVAKFVVTNGSKWAVTRLSVLEWMDYENGRHFLALSATPF